MSAIVTRTEQDPAVVAGSQRVNELPLPEVNVWRFGPFSNLNRLLTRASKAEETYDPEAANIYVSILTKVNPSDMVGSEERRDALHRVKMILNNSAKNADAERLAAVTCRLLRENAATMPENNIPLEELTQAALRGGEFPQSHVRALQAFGTLGALADRGGLIGESAISNIKGCLRNDDPAIIGMATTELMIRNGGQQALREAFRDAALRGEVVSGSETPAMLRVIATLQELGDPIVANRRKTQ
jgi:hypothetical protein